MKRSLFPTASQTINEWLLTLRAVWSGPEHSAVRPISGLVSGPGPLKVAFVHTFHSCSQESRKGAETPARKFRAIALAEQHARRQAIPTGLLAVCSCDNLAHPHKCSAGAHAAVACRPIPGAEPGRPQSQWVHWRVRWRRGGCSRCTGGAAACKAKRPHILLAVLGLSVDLQAAINTRTQVKCWLDAAHAQA